MNRLTPLLVAASLWLPALVTTGAAATTGAELQSAVENLNDACRGIDVRSLALDLAKVIKLEPTVIEKALDEEKLQLSDVVLAQAIADQTGQPFAQVVKDNPKREWGPALSTAKAPLDQVIGRLEKVNAEVSFLNYEKGLNRKKKKK